MNLKSRVRGTTHVVGVFGWPIEHSASPAMHNAAFDALDLDYVYVPFAVQPENIAAAVQSLRVLNIVGVNVTVPLKESIPPWMDSLTPRARAIGSVNTIVNRNGYLSGDSTDGAGFLAGLQRIGLEDIAGKRFVLLGAGGSARAIAYALAVAGGSVTIANRNRERADSLIADLQKSFADDPSITPGELHAIPLDEAEIATVLPAADVLVNTTSVGMYPETDAVPVSIPFDSRLIVCDLIYNPFETKLLAQARQAGCRTQNGVEMLVQQGVLSFGQWTNIQLPLSVVDAMRDAVLKAIGAPLANQ